MVCINFFYLSVVKCSFVKSVSRRILDVNPKPGECLIMNGLKLGGQSTDNPALLQQKYLIHFFKSRHN